MKIITNFIVLVTWYYATNYPKTHCLKTTPCYISVLWVGIWAGLGWLIFLLCMALTGMGQWCSVMMAGLAGGSRVLHLHAWCFSVNDWKPGISWGPPLSR